MNANCYSCARSCIFPAEKIPRQCVCGVWSVCVCERCRSMGMCVICNILYILVCATRSRRSYCCCCCGFERAQPIYAGVQAVLRKPFAVLNVYGLEHWLCVAATTTTTTTTTQMWLVASLYEIVPIGSGRSRLDCSCHRFHLLHLRRLSITLCGTVVYLLCC